MIDWADVCRPKNQGGLGISNYRKMNLALVTKWICKISQKYDGFGQGF